MTITSIKRLLLFLSVAFAFLAAPVKASDEGFYQGALEYFQKNCSRENLSNQHSLLCYLFDKLHEVESDTDQLKEVIQGIDERVKSLEQQQGPSVLEVVFFNHEWHSVGDNSGAIDTVGYKLITFYFDRIPGVTGAYDIFYSNDGLSWIFQKRVEGWGTGFHPFETTLPTKERFYKLVVVNGFEGGATAILY